MEFPHLQALFESKNGTKLTATEKSEIISNFKEWSGGSTPDECPPYPDEYDANDEPTHQGYIESALDIKFKGREAAVEAFLDNYTRP